MNDVPPDRPLFIGLDLGTSSLKAVALGAGGEVAARAHARYATDRPEPWAAEQDPHDWWAAVEAAVAQLRDGGAPAARWAAVGLSGMIPTLVVTDGDGEPVVPAITWEDGRAEPFGDALRERLGPDHLYARTGQWVDGRYLLPMFERLGRVAPEALERARWLLGAKDWLVWRLTGEPATDPSTATGFGCFGLESGDWLYDVLDVAGGGLPLPSLPGVWPSESALRLSGEAAARLGLPAGLPVAVGAADSVLGCLGLGVTSPGQVAYVAGTSTVVLGVADRLVLDDHHRYLVTPLAGTPGWGFEMDQLATGSAVRWLAGLLGEARGDEGRLMAMAAGVEPGAGGLSFLPFVAPGEQGALWDPALSGTVIGLSLSHGQAQVARALVDGIVLESRRCLDVLEQAGLPRGDVNVAGGSGADPVFRQQLADASRRRVVYAGDGETAHSAIGAALLAMAATTRTAGPSMRRTQGPVVTSLEVLEPRASESARWDELWDRHEQALASIRTASPGARSDTGGEQA